MNLLLGHITYDYLETEVLVVICLKLLVTAEKVMEPHNIQILYGETKLLSTGLTDMFWRRTHTIKCIPCSMNIHI